MDQKYLKFYQNFHKAFQGKESNHCFVQVSDSGVVYNSKLKERL